MSAVNPLRDLDALRLGRALRRTRVTAAILGLIALLVGGLIAEPLGGLGVVLGLLAGGLNTKWVDATVSKLRDLGLSAKAARRPMAGRTMSRLGVTTVVVIGLMIVLPPMGLGMLLGLALYQAAFLASMIGAVFSGGPA